MNQNNNFRMKFWVNVVIRDSSKMGKHFFRQKFSIFSHFVFKNKNAKTQKIAKFFFLETTHFYFAKIFALQIYAKFRDFFPRNICSYFVCFSQNFASFSLENLVVLQHFSRLNPEVFCYIFRIKLSWSAENDFF